MSGTIIGSLPYIELQPKGQLLRPADVRKETVRAATISHIGYQNIENVEQTRNRAQSNPERNQGYQKLGDGYLASKNYESAIRVYVKANDVLKIEESLKGWHSEILDFIKIVDGDFQKGTIREVESALESYEKIFGRLLKMKELVKGKCHLHMLRAEISNVFQKITESKKKIEELNAPASIHEAITCLSYYSLKSELDLPSIISLCNYYINESSKLNEKSQNKRDVFNVTIIKKQAEILTNRLAHLRVNLNHYELDEHWDKTYIKAIQAIDQNPSALFADHTYFVSEYAKLFNEYLDLREGMISLSQKGFVDVMEKIQERLVKHLTRKFTFGSCFCMEPPQFALLPHESLRADEIRQWIAEALKNYKIKDIQDVLGPVQRDQSEEKEPEPTLLNRG